MRRNTSFLIFSGLLIFLNSHVFAQTEIIENQVKYRSPIRYVIVYNDTLNEDERRIEVLMDERAFNMVNLTKVFNLIKKRFPTPSTLEIAVHLNLVMIETPEEREMLRDSGDTRFVNQHFKYKKASFTRYENGREAFSYTIRLSPYTEKTVVLVDKAIASP